MEGTRCLAMDARSTKPHSGRIVREAALARRVGRIGALGGLLSLVCVQSAEARPSSLDLTCVKAQGLVAAQGAIVLGTGGYTYDRFVRHAGFCQATEIGRRAFVPTRDTPRCFIGYTCFEPSGSDRFGSF